MPKKMEVQDDSGDKKYFTIIPNYILNHSTANDQALYLQMKRLAGDDGRCSKGVRYYMKKMGVGYKAIKKSLDYLVEHKWIDYVGRVEGRTGPIDCYKVNDIWEMNIQHYQKKSVTESEHSISGKSQESVTERKGERSQKQTQSVTESEHIEEQEEQEHNNSVGEHDQKKIENRTYNQELFKGIKEVMGESPKDPAKDRLIYPSKIRKQCPDVNTALDALRFAWDLEKPKSQGGGFYWRKILTDGMCLAKLHFKIIPSFLRQRAEEKQLRQLNEMKKGLFV